MDRTLPSTWHLLRSAWSAGFPASMRDWHRCLSALGVLVVVAPLELINRVALRLDDWLFPEYRRVEIRRPLFIVGPPRSGTTWLHRIIAADTKRFTTFPLWELLFAPAVCQKLFWRRCARCDALLGGPSRRLLGFLERSAPRSLNAAHPTSLMMPEEDHLLLASRRVCFLWVVAFPNCEQLWNLGRFDECIPEPQRRDVLRHYRSLLQRHLYVAGPDRDLLSKNPSFSGWVRSLAEEFPDARFIGLLRAPHEALPSQLSSLRAGLAWFGYDLHDPQLIERFVELFERYYAHVIEQLSNLPPERAQLLRYQSLRSEPSQVVAEALGRLGETLDEADLHRLDGAERESREYRSQHCYQLSEFGLTEPELRERFADVYCWLAVQADQHLTHTPPVEEVDSARSPADAVRSS